MSSKSKKSRPVSTAAISHPQVQDRSTPNSLSQFSPNADLFALLSLAVDKHRLRIFDTTTGNALVEYTVDAARVTSLDWATLDLSSDMAPTDESPAKKRKKTASAVLDPPQANTHYVVLGLSNGSILLFSPAHTRVLRTLSHPSSLAALLATSSRTRPSHIWSSSTDGVVRLWNAARNELLGSWNNDSGVPYSALVPRPDQSPDADIQLLVANHAIRLLSLLTPSTSSISEPAKPDQLFSFTGHASAVNHLQWDSSNTTRFISTAEADRFVSVWRVPDGLSKQGVMQASIPVDASVRQATLSPTDPPTLLALSASGKISLFELPVSPKTKSKVETLSARSTISAPSKKGDEDVHVVAASFVPQEHGSIRVARLKGGVKPIFEEVRYLDDTGKFVSQVSLAKDVSASLAATVEGGGPSTSQKRYSEVSGLAVHSGLEMDQDAALDNLPTNGLDGDLDVDLAELSLGQRLTALSGGADITMGDDTSSAEEAAPATKPTRRKKTRKEGGDGDTFTVPAHSLSRTLVQALHSGDTRLLETCLLHSDERVVLNTVRRLPPQLAVPLLTACVERLERGPKVNTGKGGAGGASAQRGTGLIRWVRAVLIVHSAHLMTIPDLVARLAGLYATLTSRLALRDPLLSLNGRLDLVLSQIEMRASSGPAPIAPGVQGEGQKKDKRGPVKYIEGESESGESEGDAGGMEVEQDDGGDGDGGSVEDVELGGESASDENEGESESDQDEDVSEDEEIEEGPRFNGFIDDEAEKWTDEDEDDGEYEDE